MRNYKGNLLLIELLIVILFFSLSQLVVVRLFAAANDKALSSEVLSAALLSAENTAECLSREKDPDQALINLGFTGGDGRYLYTSENGFDLLLTLRREKQAAGELLSGSLAAQSNGRALFTLPVAYYISGEVTP